MSNSKSVKNNAFLEIGVRIKQIRNSKCWSQEYLARRARVKLSTLRSIENTTQKPRHTTLVKIARALNIDIRQLSSQHGMINPADATASVNTATATVGHVTKVLETNAIMTMQTDDDAEIPSTPSKDEAPTLPCKLVVPELIEWSRRQTAELNRLDGRIGGKQLYGAGYGTLGFLQTLLHSRIASGQNERDLRLAIAHAAVQLGWFAEDAEMLDQATGHYHLGIEVARSVEGKDFVVYGLTRLAAVALAQGNPEQCLSRLAFAEHEAGEGSPWESFISLFAVEAYGQLGDGKIARATLAKADKQYDNRNQDLVPEWAFWLPRPSESAIAARSFLSTDPKFSATLYEGALEQVSTKFVCWRLHLLAGLATAKLALGETDEALSHAGGVLQSITSLDMSIPRVENLLMKFEAQLPDDPITNDFRERFARHQHIQQN